ncbi:MAG TPA: BamA/TamA family outer membrane protein [Cyclobacteriaceae bacterium]
MQKRNKQDVFAQIYSNVIWFLSFLIFAGCSATHFLHEGESFYTGAELKINAHGKIPGKRRIKEDLQSFITPKPNTTILGARPSVWFYFIAGQLRKEKGFRFFIKNKLGKPPVLLTDATPDKTSVTLENELNNEGYFRSTVDYDIITKHKKSKIRYTISLERPYRLRHINYSIADTIQFPFVKASKTKSLLKEERRYRLERLASEQQRIKELAENNGYYYFDERYLLFEADSTVGDHHVDLNLVFEKGIPERAKQTFRIKSINVYPNYSLGNDSLATTGDTTLVNGYRYIDNQHAFKPEIITNVINIKTDSLYRRINHEYTLSRLMSLKTFKYVNIKYSNDTTDSAALNANIYLTPLLKKSVQVQVQGISKSNNFVGPGFELTFTNRNLLRGAEMFQFKMHGAYEWQISRQQSGALNAVEFGSEVSLAIPRFITPFKIRYRYAKYLPQTQFKVAYNFQQRLQYFKLTSFNISYGYTWRETTLKTHEFYPADISFVKASKTSSAFDELLAKNPTLANSFQNQFIPGLRYSFTLNTQLREDIEEKYLTTDKRKSDFYFNATISLAGNLLHALESAQKSDNKSMEIFNSPYSQFVMGSIDFRYYRQLNKHQKLATRLILGAGYAYGNSAHLPYIKQFSIGGSSSVRAFPARSLGPGTYNVRTDPAIKTNTYFIDQRGDMKLEANIEYRFDIVKALKGAFFFDAGNIWLVNKDEDRKGGEFDKDKFLGQLAVGTGFGLRYDFNFFILRLDAAFPIRKPYLEPSKRWIVQRNFGSSSWLKENLIFNIAIGYPF